MIHTLDNTFISIFNNLKTLILVVNINYYPLLMTPTLTLPPLNISTLNPPNNKNPVIFDPFFNISKIGLTIFYEIVFRHYICVNTKTDLNKFYINRYMCLSVCDRETMAEFLQLKTYLVPLMIELILLPRNIYIK